MVIEWLIFDVPQAHQAKFLRFDAAIWTPFLAEQSGFVSKEVWMQPDAPSRLNLVIRWTTLAQWKAIPSQALAAVDAAFQTATGAVYPVQSCLTYHILPDA